jgi:hypothetical protein
VCESSFRVQLCLSSLDLPESFFFVLQGDSFYVLAGHTTVSFVSRMLSVGVPKFGKFSGDGRWADRFFLSDYYCQVDIHGRSVGHKPRISNKRKYYFNHDRVENCPLCTCREDYPLQECQSHLSSAVI